MMPQKPVRGGRVVSAIELIIGAAIIVGHNVYRVVPNEVPILAALALLSMFLRKGGAAVLGLKRPSSWRTILLVALGAAILRLVLGDLVIDPLTNQFWPPAIAPAGTETIRGNLGVAASTLLLVWTFAAFGEELGYRGYLLARAEHALGGGRAGAIAALIISSILFGIGHYYKGPSGIIDSGIAGLILGAIYLACGRNLWVSIFAHGFIDTIAVIFVYLGLDS